MTDKNPTFKIKANDFEFTFTLEQIDKVDLIKKSPTEYNLLHHQHSVNARLVALNEESKKLTIEVEGENNEIETKDELDQMQDKMGFGLAKHKTVKEKSMGNKLNCPVTAMYAPIGARLKPTPKTKWHNAVKRLV